MFNSLFFMRRPPVPSPRPIPPPQSDSSGPNSKFGTLINEAPALEMLEPTKPTDSIPTVVLGGDSTLPALSISNLQRILGELCRKGPRFASASWGYCVAHRESEASLVLENITVRPPSTLICALRIEHEDGSASGHCVFFNLAARYYVDPVMRSSASTSASSPAFSTLQEGLRNAGLCQNEAESSTHSIQYYSSSSVSCVWWCTLFCWLCENIGAGAATLDRLQAALARMGIVASSSPEGLFKNEQALIAFFKERGITPARIDRLFQEIDPVSGLSKPTPTLLPITRAVRLRNYSANVSLLGKRMSNGSATRRETEFYASLSRLAQAPRPLVTSGDGGGSTARNGVQIAENKGRMIKEQRMVTGAS